MSTQNALFSGGVLTLTDGEVTLTEEFDQKVASERNRIADYSPAELEAEVRDRVADATVVDPVVNLCTDDPRIAAELFTLTEFVDDTAAVIRLLPPLWLFHEDAVRTDGAPESFIPVPATRLPSLLSIYSPALVYVWLDDSEKCDLAKADLEAVFETQQEVMPFAVYGPAYKEFLEEEYDLSAGPAILFTRDGAVEARLYGAHGPATIEAELDRHRG